MGAAKAGRGVEAVGWRRNLDAISVVDSAWAKDGSWEFRFGVFGKGGVKKGKLGADELQRWIKDIEDGGFHKLESNPKLGGPDESFMDITIRAKGEKTQKRISSEERLSQAVHKRVFELAKPEK